MTLTLPDVDVSHEIEQAIREALSCQWDLVSADAEQPCPEAAEWLIVFRLRCEHGAPILMGDPVLCTRHKRVLSCEDKHSYFCGACACPVTVSSHMILNILELSK